MCPARCVAHALPKVATIWHIIFLDRVTIMTTYRVSKCFFSLTIIIFQYTVMSYENWNFQNLIILFFLCRPNVICSLFSMVRDQIVPLYATCAQITYLRRLNVFFVSDIELRSKVYRVFTNIAMFIIFKYIFTKWNKPNKLYLLDDLSRSYVSGSNDRTLWLQ